SGRPVRDAGLPGIPGRDDAGLHRVLGRVGRVARGHRALEPGAHVAVAVVAADAQDDAALLVHGPVPGLVGRQRAAPPRAQAARLRISTLYRVRRLPVVLQYRGDEGRLVSGVGGVGTVGALEHA